MFIFDGHCDTLCLTADEKRGLLNREGIGQLDINEMMKYDVKAQVFAVFVEDIYCPDNISKRALKMINSFHNEMLLNERNIVHVKNSMEVENAISRSKISAFLSIEGGEALGGELFMLELFYQLGVRFMGLTWNRRNELADGIYEGENASGLSRFGKTVVKRMNELGMVVDVSHLSDKGFFDVVGTTDSPIIASHSNCREIADHPRNITDEQIKLIAGTGGTIGVTFVKPFIGMHSPNLRGLFEHIDHICNLVGADHVAIGSDFDGVTDDYMPDDIKDLSVFLRLQALLIKEGYSSESISKIFGSNLLRVIKEVMG